MWRPSESTNARVPVLCLVWRPSESTNVRVPVLCLLVPIGGCPGASRGGQPGLSREKVPPGYRCTGVQRCSVISATLRSARRAVLSHLVLFSEAEEENRPEFVALEISCDWERHKPTRGILTFLKPEYLDF